MTIPFIKMNAAGNDFIFIDCRKKNYNLTKSQIAKISNRKNIGCDQFILIKNSVKADVFMDIYNSDGSSSAACGNATRCLAGLISQEKNDKEINIETKSGILNCQINGEIISVYMGIPKFDSQEIPTTAKNPQNMELFGYNFSALNIGNPHAVTFLKERISDQEFFDIGPKIESHEIFPEKINVEFVNQISNTVFEVRVYERGAGETLACGSGACAVGIFAIKNKLTSENKILTKFKGGDIEIEWDKEGSQVIMSGNYHKDFEGEISADLLV